MRFFLETRFGAGYVWALAYQYHLHPIFGHPISRLERDRVTKSQHQLLRPH